MQDEQVLAGSVWVSEEEPENAADVCAAYMMIANEFVDAPDAVLTLWDHDTASGLKGSWANVDPEDFIDAHDLRPISGDWFDRIVAHRMIALDKDEPEPMSGQVITMPMNVLISMRNTMRTVRDDCDKAMSGEWPVNEEGLSAMKELMETSLRRLRAHNI
jgi:hypothetical protein